ncbi:MAG TPA: hypothetical protein IAB20_04325 [Candidatus Pullichristensenella excrementipullorum]|nr:hypothetical protein [Candidatus Pullichristensenella excrementipullorum]
MEDTLGAHQKATRSSQAALRNIVAGRVQKERKESKGRFLTRRVTGKGNLLERRYRTGKQATQAGVQKDSRICQRYGIEQGRSSKGQNVRKRGLELKDR